MNKVFKNCTNEKINEIKNKFVNNLEFSQDKNVNFVIKIEDCTITVYNSKTIMLQGNKVEYYLNLFNLENVQNTSLENNYFLESIGSDETGVGDFFGPVVIGTVIFLKNTIEPSILKEVKDSKKLSDEKISELYFKLKNKITYNIEIITNQEYNNLINKYSNMHFPKAIGHNRSILKIIKKSGLNNLPIIIDQFAPKESYFKYLSYENEVIKSNVFFKTKAESYYISVAIASIISRYYFLMEIKKISNELNTSIPLGANNNVKILVQKIKRENKNASNYIKMHFNDKIK